MKNTIIYYYNLHIDDVHQQNDRYYFFYDEEKYYLIPYKRPKEDLKSLYELNLECLRRNILVSEIVLNKDRSIVTYYNNIPYILLKVYVNEVVPVTLKDIWDINFKTKNINQDKVLIRTNYFKLWSSKVDYFEYQMSQLGKDYLIIRDTIAYYIGLAENAISYAKNTELELKTNRELPVVCHKRIKKDYTLFDLYNPLNLIIDYKERDLSEYIKTKFFNDSSNLIVEIKEYLEYNVVTSYGARMLFSRLLYPSYYFDLYEKIIEGKIPEKNIIPIIEKVNDYEIFLKDIYEYLVNRGLLLPPIDWINKL